ncbi:hypothetical protein D3C80_2207230 [compost metagenome]
MTTRYITATTSQISNEAKVLAITIFPDCVSSTKPIIERMDVSFSVITSWLMNAGIMIRIACGIIILNMAFR